jgi:hypothetical protein
MTTLAMLASIPMEVPAEYCMALRMSARLRERFSSATGALVLEIRTT